MVIRSRRIAKSGGLNITVLLLDFAIRLGEVMRGKVFFDCGGVGRKS